MSRPSQPVLACRGLSMRFEDAGRLVVPFSGFDLEVRAGESVAITGPSGAGKTTLLQLLGGLERATEGQVLIQGRELSRLSDRERTALRGKAIGFVYQFHHLLGELTALENVAMPLRIARVSASQARSRAAELLTQLGLSHRLDHLPSALSGGERQRVAIARALVTRPAVVLADEPTGNLDASNAAQVFDLLMTHVRAQSAALVLVTHDQRLADRCDRVIELRSQAH
ncbi:MAG: ABC transporter ATP-binding protein [Betaproteobacteria bacterium]|nr:ABC transporter ATP-binding protein [Betaproteobacteria bacterium]